MSFWGTGIKQSDEFFDVHEDFFEAYKDDAAAEDVYRAILNEYLQEFPHEDESPIMYTVYYALAQCLWECGCKDDALWQKIKTIIDSGADLRFWNELGDEPRIEKSRQRELLKFWDRINSTPAKIKKPKKTQKKREPTLHKGDLYAYPCQNGYRVALVLDYIWNSFLTAISENIFENLPTEEEAMDAYTHTVTWFSARASIPKKDRITIAVLEINGNYNNRAGLVFSDRIAGCSAIGEREYFYDPDKAAAAMEKAEVGRYKMAELLDPEVLPKYLPRVDASML